MKVWAIEMSVATGFSLWWAYNLFDGFSQNVREDILTTDFIQQKYEGLGI